MPSYQPVIKNGASGAILYASLLDTANPATFKTNPTIVAGDFKVSIDGSAFANLVTLPSVVPVGGSQVKFTLSQAETNGDNLTIQCVDQTAPKEWCDAFIRIQTAAIQFDSVANLGHTVPAIPLGTVTAGATSTTVPTSACTPPGAGADQFKGRTMLFDATTITAALRGCGRSIAASSNAAAPTFTVDALPAVPVSGDTFSIV